MTTPKQTVTLSDRYKTRLHRHPPTTYDRGLISAFFEDATRIAKEKLNRPQPPRRRPLMAQINRELRESPELRRICRHEQAVLDICEALVEKGYHVTQRRKMEKYLDLVYELGFEVRRRTK